MPRTKRLLKDHVRARFLAGAFALQIFSLFFSEVLEKVSVYTLKARARMYRTKPTVSQRLFFVVCFSSAALWLSEYALLPV